MPRTIGIDLGANSSVVAYMDKATAQPKCIPGPYGEIFCPSVVSINGDGGLIVGSPARRRLLSQPDRTAGSAKHAMGRSLDEIHEELRATLRADPESRDVVRVRLGECLFTLPEISAFLLRELKTWAEVSFGEPVSQAVIAVPAYFDDAQRRATQQAGELAEFEVLRLVNEPAAAALAYGLHQQRRGHVAVFDLGGSKFEISVLQLVHESEGESYQVLSTHEDAHLGGDDLDEVLLGVAREEIRIRHGMDLGRDAQTAETLRRALVQAKHELSFADRASLEVPLPDRSLYVREIGRAEFEGLVQPILDRIAGPMTTALADAKLTVEEIDDVVLVGGSTHIPLVRRMAEQFFGRRAHAELNPDEVVALGAAVQADIIESGAGAAELEGLAERRP